VRRALLVLAMLVSLWPVAVVALAATASSNSGGGTQDVVVTTPESTNGPPVQPQTVKIKVGGRTYRCPIRTEDHLKPDKQTLGDLELKLKTLSASLRAKEARLRKLDTRYPGRSAPASVADEYNTLLRSTRAGTAREDRLVRDYNEVVHRYNDIIESECN
jgi:hypothetical protein